MKRTAQKIVITLICAYSILSCAYSKKQNTIIHHSIHNSAGCLIQKVPELALHTTIIHALQKYNAASGSKLTDKEWLELPIDAPHIQALTQNNAAKMMRTHIVNASWQGEGILIGRDGGLVAITEKTSDYWQHDEQQFTRAMLLPKGEIYVQKQVIDKSTHSMLIKVSTPVYNANRTEKPIGVLVIGFDQFVVDFNQPCKKNNPI